MQANNRERNDYLDLAAAYLASSWASNGEPRTTTKNVGVPRDTTKRSSLSTVRSFGREGERGMNIGLRNNLAAGVDFD